MKSSYWPPGTPASAERSAGTNLPGIAAGDALSRRLVKPRPPSSSGRATPRPAPLCRSRIGRRWARAGGRPASWVLFPVRPCPRLPPAVCAHRPRPVPCRGLVRACRPAFVLRFGLSVGPPDVAPSPPRRCGEAGAPAGRGLSRPASAPACVRAAAPRSPSPPSRSAALPALGPRCPFRGRVASGLSAGSRSLRCLGCSARPAGAAAAEY